VFNGGAGSLALTTTGDDVRINGAVTLASAVTIGTGPTVGGNITFTNDAPIDSAAGENNNLTLEAGLGAVRFNENLGEFTALGNLTVTRADAGVTFGQADVEVPGTGGLGPVDIVNTLGGLNIGSTNAITGGIVLDPSGSTLMLISSGGTIRFNGDVDVRATDVLISTNELAGGDIVFETGLTPQGNGITDLTLTSGLGDVVINGPLGTATNRFDDVLITVANNVTIQGTLEASSFTLESGTGETRFGSTVNLIGQLLIESGNTTVFAGALNASSFTQQAGTGETRFESTVNVSDVVGPGLDINAGAITFLGEVNVTGNGRVFLTNSGTLTIGTGANFTANGAIVQDGTGAVIVNANVTTTDDEIRFSPSADPNADVAAAASITLADGTELRTNGTATIRMRAEGDIALSRLVTGGLISIQSDDGAIIDNGDTGVTGVADLEAPLVALRAARGIGDDGAVDPTLNAAAADLPSATTPRVQASAIDTRTATLSARNTLDGDIQISNTTGALLTIGTVDGLSGITNTDLDGSIGSPTVAPTLSGGVIWITNGSPISVSNPVSPNAAEGVYNSAGGSVIITATGAAAGSDATIGVPVGMVLPTSFGNDLGVFAPVQATRGTGGLLLNAGDDLNLSAPILTAVGPFQSLLPDRSGNIDLNAGGDLRINNSTTGYEVQTGTYFESADASGSLTSINENLRNSDTQPNRQIRYTRGGQLLPSASAMLASNVVHQVHPTSGATVATRLLSNSGVISGAPVTYMDVEGDVVTLPGLTPLLVSETFVTPQVGSDGFATISGRFGRVGEVNFRLLVSWGDDTFSYDHLTGDADDAVPSSPIQEMTDERLPLDDPDGVTTTRTFYFEHFYNSKNLPDPDNPAAPITIRVILQGAPNIVEVDGNDQIRALDVNELLESDDPMEPDQTVNPASFLANTDQFILSELLADDLEAANLGAANQDEFGTGLGARIDTYRASDNQDQIIDGVQNPFFNTTEFQFFPMPGVPGLPAIVDAQMESALQRAFSLNASAASNTMLFFGQPNALGGASVASVPGQGVDNQTSGFVFDLSVKNPELEFPRTIVITESSVTSSSSSEAESSASSQAAAQDESAAVERVVWLKVLRPTGQVTDRIPENPEPNLIYEKLESGGYSVWRVAEEVPLAEDVLDDLPQLVFEKLPDGRYQIWLQEAGEKRQRLILEVIIRDGRPADDAQGTQDRPPTATTPDTGKNGTVTPDSSKQPPVPNTTGGEGSGNPPADDGQAEAAPQAEQLEQQSASVDGLDRAWETFGAKNGLDRWYSTGPQESRADDQSVSTAGFHPLAAGALLAGGAVVMQLRHRNWDEEADDTMARWEAEQRKRDESRRLARHDHDNSQPD